MNKQVSTYEWGKGDRDRQVKRFLEGPQNRSFEFLQAVRIFLDCMRGFRLLHFVGPCVTVFGSARFPEDHPYYSLARSLAAGLARVGFSVVTGGGPGIMEAANRGARDSGGYSIGCNIQLPEEQTPNQFLDRFVEFRYFFVRKLMLTKYSYAFVALPGGYGTMDEIFETATLIQTRKIKDFPLVLMGVEYWKPLMRYLEDTLFKSGTIDRADFERIVLTDSVEQAINHIVETSTSKFGLKWSEKRHKASRWLWEKE